MSTSAHFPDHPIGLAVIALLAQKPDRRNDEVDLFACGRTFGNLLRFIRNIDKPFRFVVELVGETVFFVRRENSPTEKIEAVRGYGNAFPERYTTWCIVRSEADGYLARTGREGHIGDRCVFIASAERTTAQSWVKLIPQKTVFYLKTRSVKRQDDDVLGEELGRLRARQIPNFVLAFHKYGVFNTIEVRDVRQDIEEYEMDNQNDLPRLASLVANIVRRARDLPETS